jgi:hypothetical protein
MKQTQNQQRESAVLPAQKQGLLLRLTADMFRQHSELYLKHAAVLERVASNPSDPLAWQLEEPSPESIQDKLLQENVAALAVKGYQSMLQVQKRVNFMEGLMMKNGIGKRAYVKELTARRCDVRSRSCVLTNMLVYSCHTELSRAEERRKK